MSHALTVADLAPALVALGAGLMGTVAVWHATRGTRALRRRRREAAARAPEAGVAPEGGDAAKAKELAAVIVRLFGSEARAETESALAERRARGTGA